MNGEDMIRALEARRDECQAAIGQVRRILALLHGPAVPVKIDRPTLEREAAQVPPPVRRPVVLTDDRAATLVGYLVAHGPSTKAQLLAGVPGTSPEHLQQLVRAKRIVATGNTVRRKYAAPKPRGAAAKDARAAQVAALVVEAPPELETVWRGGEGLSSYQQKLRG